MESMTAMIKTLGTADVTPERKQNDCRKELLARAGIVRGRTAQQENELIIGLLRSRAQSENRRTKSETPSCIKSDTSDL